MVKYGFSHNVSHVQTRYWVTSLTSTPDVGGPYFSFFLS